MTQLKLKKRSPRETRDFLMEAGISCREIFDDFNYFYFGYVSLDWLDVLMEYYGKSGGSACPAEKETGAGFASLLSEDGKPGRRRDFELADGKEQKEEEELDAVYSLDGNRPGYQRNPLRRKHRAQIYQSALDLDRTTFICFLLFFGNLPAFVIPFA